VLDKLHVQSAECLGITLLTLDIVPCGGSEFIIINYGVMGLAFRLTFYPHHHSHERSRFGMTLRYHRIPIPFLSESIDYKAEIILSHCTSLINFAGFTLLTLKCLFIRSKRLAEPAISPLRDWIYCRIQWQFQSLCKWQTKQKRNLTEDTASMTQIGGK
jgi:hypothetical protein